MVSVDLIAMVTSEASDGHERKLRAKRVMVVFNDTPMEEGSGVFFLTLLTSSSLCPHSYGGRFWSVLPHCSLRHPCVLTPMTCLLTHLIVIPDFSLESSHPSHP